MIIFRFDGVRKRVGFRIKMEQLQLWKFFWRSCGLFGNLVGTELGEYIFNFYFICWYQRFKKFVFVVYKGYGIKISWILVKVLEFLYLDFKGISINKK